MRERHLRQAIELALVPFDVGEGEVLLVEGEADDAMMIVVSGQVQVTIGQPPAPLATLGKGELLGEMAIFGRFGRRYASVRTLTPCTLLLLEGDSLKTLRHLGNDLVHLLESVALRSLGKRLRDMNDRISQLAEGGQLGGESKATLLNRLTGLFRSHNPNPSPTPPDAVAVLNAAPTFADPELQAVAELAGLMQPVPVPQGSVVITEGAIDGDAYVVASGEVEVYRTTGPDQHALMARFGPGDFFGLVALVHGRTRTATCYAATPCWLLRLPGQTYAELVRTSRPEARVLRRAVYEGLSQQLAMANGALAELSAPPSVS